MKKQVVKIDKVIIWIVMGIFLIALGIIPLILALNGLLPDVQGNDFWAIVIMTVLVSPLGVWLLIAGIIDFHRYKVTKEVIKNGTRGTCTIMDYKNLSSRYAIMFYMIVRYVGKSGKSIQSKVLCSFSDLKDYPKGTTIQCLIYQDDCYVDIHNIKVVKELDI